MKANHSGQVALIMVLIMTVISAVAVSVASRSTVETRIQQMNVENTEALLAAQAGLEESIAKSTPVSGTFGTGQYQVSLNEAGSGSVISEKINPGETLEIDLDGAVGVTGLKIFWKPAILGSFPAIFVSDVRNDQTLNYAYDATDSNGFTQALTGETLEGVSYTYSTPVLVISQEFSKNLRITVLGSSAFLGIQPEGGLLSPQSINFRAVADVASTNQNVVKYGIEYIESKSDQVPSVFGYVLFSGGSIVQ